MTIKSFYKKVDPVQPIDERPLPPTSERGWEAKFPRLTAMGIVPDRDFENASTSPMRSPKDPPRPRMRG